MHGIFESELVLRYNFNSCPKHLKFDAKSPKNKSNLDLDLLDPERCSLRAWQAALSDYSLWPRGEFPIQLVLSSRLFLRKLPTNEETLPCLTLGALVGLSAPRSRWKRRCFLSGSACSAPRTHPRLPESTSFLSVGLVAPEAASAFRSEEDEDLRRYDSRFSGDELCSRSRSICSFENRDECFLAAPAEVAGLFSTGDSNSSNEL